jgi:serine/threonine protein kinase
MSNADSSQSLRLLVDGLCDEFEAQLRAGQHPKIEDYLARRAESERAPLLLELLKIEFSYLHQSNRAWSLEDYLQRFHGQEEIVQTAYRELCSSFDTVPSTVISVGHRLTKGGSSKPAKSPDTNVIELSTRDSAAHAPPPDRIGKYKILKLLGKGAFANVYLGKDEVLERLVAVKVPRTSRLTGSTSSSAFQSEARLLARLDHPHIVRIYDAEQTEEGLCYIASQYIEGGTLADRLRQGPLTREEALRIVLHMAEALHHAHLKGLVHRDVKPANILLDRSGQPRLADFGLAIHEQMMHERAGELAGTLSFMAPEQVRRESHRLDGRTDVWALGSLMYLLLTGRCPFEGPDNDSIADQILHRPARPLRQIDDAIPESLDRICLKCLAKNVEDRYATAKDLADDLRAAMAGLDQATATPLAQPTTDAKPTRPDSLRRRPDWLTRSGCHLTSVVSLGLALLSLGLVPQLRNLGNAPSPGDFPLVQATPDPQRVPQELQGRPAYEPLRIALQRSPHSEMTAPIPQAPLPARIGWQILALREGDRDFRELHDGNVLRSLVDRYVILAQPATRGHLYVFQVDAQGYLQWLFPTNSATNYSSGSNPVAAGELLRIPADESKALFLDEQRGVEHIFAVFSAVPWPSLEAALTEAAKKSPPVTSPAGRIESPFSIKVRGAAGTVTTPVPAGPSFQYVDPNSAIKHPLSFGSRELYSGPFVVSARYFYHR